MMLLTQIIMCALLFYSVDNGKYHPAEINGKMYIMNTRDSTFIKVCDEKLECKAEPK